jgi:hypothetical protein
LLGGGRRRLGGGEYGWGGADWYGWGGADWYGWGGGDWGGGLYGVADCGGEP